MNEYFIEENKKKNIKKIWNLLKTQLQYKIIKINNNISISFPINE